MTSFPASHMREAAAILGTRSKRQRRKIRREQRPRDVEITTRMTPWSVAEQAWLPTRLEPTSHDDRPHSPNLVMGRSWVEVAPIVSVADRRKQRTNLSYNESIVARHDPSTPKPVMSKSREIRPPVQRDWSPSYTAPIPSAIAHEMAKRIADREAARFAMTRGCSQAKARL